jgi:hypothetical protein
MAWSLETSFKIKMWGWLNFLTIEMLTHGSKFNKWHHMGNLG